VDGEERLRLAFDRVSPALREVVEELEVTEPELRAVLGFLDDDTIGAVKPELTGRLEKHDDPEELHRRGLDRPFFTYAYDFMLVPSTSRGGAGDGS
jgi:hypothetical protein